MSEQETIYWIFEIGAFVIFTVELVVFALAFHILMNYLMKIKKVRNQYLKLFLSYSIRKMTDKEWKNLQEDMRQAKPKVKEV